MHVLSAFCDCHMERVWREPDETDEKRWLRAAAFAKSFLDLEGELTPILVSLVSKDQLAHSMLDSSGVKLSKTIQVHPLPLFFLPQKSC